MLVQEWGDIIWIGFIAFPVDEYLRDVDKKELCV